MIDRPIRDPHSNKQTADRFCDVEVKDGIAYLVQKRKGKYIRIPWNDVVNQVETAIHDYKEE